jgi:hypothetical protein
VEASSGDRLWVCSADFGAGPRTVLTLENEVRVVDAWQAGETDAFPAIARIAISDIRGATQCLDVNGDGIDDVVVDANNPLFFYGPLSGDLTAVDADVAMLTGSNTFVADFTGDGMVDTLRISPSGVSVGAGPVPATTFEILSSALFDVSDILAVGDFDHDGSSDIVVETFDPPPGIGAGTRVLFGPFVGSDLDMLGSVLVQGSTTYHRTDGPQGDALMIRTESEERLDVHYAVDPSSTLAAGTGDLRLDFAGVDFFTRWLSPGAMGDLDGDGERDLVAITKGGAFLFYGPLAGDLDIDARDASFDIADARKAALIPRSVGVGSDLVLAGMRIPQNTDFPALTVFSGDGQPSPLDQAPPQGPRLTTASLPTVVPLDGTFSWTIDVFEREAGEHAVFLTGNDGNGYYVGWIDEPIDGPVAPQLDGQILGFQEAPKGVAHGDVTGDGAPDLLVLLQREIRVFPGPFDGATDVSSSLDLDLGVIGPFDLHEEVVVADADGNGILDLVYVVDNELRWASGPLTASGDLTALSSVLELGDVRRLDTADFDADGAADLVVATNDRTRILYGPVAPTIGRQSWVRDLGNSRPLDVDGDGWLDLAGYARESEDVVVVPGPLPELNPVYDNYTSSAISVWRRPTGAMGLANLRLLTVDADGDGWSDVLFDDGTFPGSTTLLYVPDPEVAPLSAGVPFTSGALEIRVGDVYETGVPHLVVADSTQGLLIYPLQP